MKFKRILLSDTLTQTPKVEMFPTKFITEIFYTKSGCKITIKREVDDTPDYSKEWDNLMIECESKRLVDFPIELY